MSFYNDIEAQIELCDNGKLCVDYDKIKIDCKDTISVDKLSIFF